MVLPGRTEPWDGLGLDTPGERGVLVTLAARLAATNTIGALNLPQQTLHINNSPLAAIRALWRSFKGHEGESVGANSPTWRGAGSVEGGAGAGGVAGATGLRLVEGPLQLPPPLDAAVLLAEVLEDLLCGRNTKNKGRRRGYGVKSRRCPPRRGGH